MKRNVLLGLVAGWSTLSALVGCNGILGIQERHLARDDGEAGATSSGGAGAPSGPSECLPDATEIRTGVIQVDGLLDAADSMITTFEQIEADFQTRMQVMAEALSIDTGGVYSSELVDAVILAMSEDAALYSANGVSVFVEEVQCRADVELALEQQNRCEKEAGCDTSVESTEVACSGLCLGDCAGPCDACRAPSSGTCSDLCLGDCVLAGAGGECSGLCDGSCNGTCTSEDTSGCGGGCDGDCQGPCELFVQDTCAGVCEGECTTPSTTACSADSICVSHCEGICSGDCVGRPVPIPGDVACESADHCATLASLLGAAGIACDPPVVQTAYDIADSAGAGATAFRARMDGVVASTPPIISGLAVLEIIAAGQLVGIPIEATPPYQLLTNELSDIGGRAERGQTVLGVAEGCEAEVSPFVDPVVEHLISLNARGAALVGDQLKLLFALQAGFH